MRRFATVATAISATPSLRSRRSWRPSWSSNRGETTGMTVLQAESEISSINMVYGGAATGKRVMTSSSSPGISLMSEGMSYLAGAELPCLVVNCQRGGPGLGTIQPSQGDYFQACKGRRSRRLPHDRSGSQLGAGDARLRGRRLRPRVQVPQPGDDPADGAIGQMMEKWCSHPSVRATPTRRSPRCKAWAACGKSADRERNVVTSLELKSEVMEQINLRLQAKSTRLWRRTRGALRDHRLRRRRLRDRGIRFVGPHLLGYGRNGFRAEGLKVGLLRPITLYPFPKKAIADLAKRGVKGFLSAELERRTDGRGRASGRERYGSPWRTTVVRAV